MVVCIHLFLLKRVAEKKDMTLKNTMNEPPLISIVTPSFNQSQFLEETIISVLEQDYPNIEYMVIDGGSIDGSLDIITKYSNRLSYWVCETDTGQSEAINKGWRRAKGKYITWLNSDDVLLPSSISIAVNYLEAHIEVQAVYGDFDRMNEKSKSIETVIRRQINWPQDIQNINNPITQPGSLIRSDVLRKIGYLDESYFFCMDLDFFIRIGLVYGNDSIVYLPTCLSRFRNHVHSKSSRAELIRLSEIEVLYKDLLNSRLTPKNWLVVKNKAFGNLYRILSQTVSDRSRAWQYLYHAWRFQWPKPDRDLLKASAKMAGILPFYIAFKR
jgi:glycosyltransferase involved in cell wall biosynthesis